jgi:hypothetical protein
MVQKVSSSEQEGNCHGRRKLVRSAEKCPFARENRPIQARNSTQASPGIRLRGSSRVNLETRAAVGSGAVAPN